MIGLPLESAPRVTIHIGGLRASREPLVIDTVLGSCIAVCMYDPVVGIGGMNHFMLAEGDDPSNPNCTRFGVHAMELLIQQLMRMGAHRRRFQAKVFGGGHVLGIGGRMGEIPRGNIEFVRRFLSIEQIPIASEDVGGNQPRRVLFFTQTSRAFVRYLGTGAAERTAHEEMIYLNNLKRERTDGDIELF